MNYECWCFLFQKNGPRPALHMIIFFLHSESQGEVISIQTRRAGACVSVLAGKTPAAWAGPSPSEHFSSRLGKPSRSVGIIHARKHSMGGR